MNNLIGEKFSKLTIISVEYNQVRNSFRCFCKCECGGDIQTTLLKLQQKRIKSCGCYEPKLHSAGKTHGLSNSRLYRIHRGMLIRCYNPKFETYYNYGGKGVTVCDEWRNDFKAFYDWAVINGYSKELTIERIKSSLGYCPSNCKWATRKEQARNTSTNRNLEINGVIKCMKDWAADYNVSYAAIINRMRNGWTEYEALFGK